LAFQGLKVKMEQDHFFLNLWSKKVIKEMMMDKTRELGLQYHGGPPQNMKELGQYWARDGSTKNAELFWRYVQC